MNIIILTRKHDIQGHFLNYLQSMNVINKYTTLTVYKSRIINSQKKLESSISLNFDFISPKNEMAEGRSPATADDSNLRSHHIQVRIYLKSVTVIATIFCKCFRKF